MDRTKTAERYTWKTPSGGILRRGYRRRLWGLSKNYSMFPFWSGALSWRRKLISWPVCSSSPFCFLVVNLCANNTLPLHLYGRWLHKTIESISSTARMLATNICTHTKCTRTHTRTRNEAAELDLLTFLFVVKHDFLAVNSTAICQ